jgi:serine/threonine protein kinase
MRWEGEDQKGRSASWETDERHVRQGGQAWIYRTTDGAHAVKVARDGAGQSLQREIAVLARLGATHEGLGAALLLPRGHGTQTDGTPFMVLPWFPFDAASWLGAAPRTLADRLALAEGCCRAVAALHWADGARDRNMAYQFDDGRTVVGRVVHRDVKPANFLVREGPDGGLDVRLNDFGAVREADANTITFASQVFTLGFAPLEQTLPRRVMPEVSWDVYALGATVFQVLTGSPPLGCIGVDDALTDKGRALRSVERKLAVRPGALSLEQERSSLEGEAIEALVDFSTLHPFSEEDAAELAKAVEAGLAEAVGEPSKTAARLCGPLVRDLQRALAGRPLERMTDARDLLGRVQWLRGEVDSLGTGAAVVLAPKFMPGSVSLKGAFAGGTGSTEATLAEDEQPLPTGSPPPPTSIDEQPKTGKAIAERLPEVQRSEGGERTKTKILGAHPKANQSTAFSETSHTTAPNIHSTGENPDGYSVPRAGVRRAALLVAVMAGIGVAAWAYSDTQARPHEQYEGILWCDLPVADEYDRQAEDCFWLTASNVYWTGGYKQVYKSKVVELPSCSDKLGIHPAGRSNGDKLDYWKDCYYREDGYKGTREGYSYAALRTFLS